MKDYQKQIDKKQARRTELFAQREPIDKELTLLANQITALKEKQTEQNLKREMSFEERFEYLMFEDGCSSDMKRYNEADKFIQELGFYMSGYNPETQQKAVKLMLYKGKNSNLEQTYNSLVKILPLIKPVNAEGDKQFSLFEHSLSENGSYVFVVGKNKCTLKVWRYHREYLVKEWEDLMEALAYIQEFHYYESSFDEGEDD